MPTRLTEQLVKMLDESHAELGLQVRTSNALEMYGVLTIGDLLECCARTRDECAQQCVCRERCPGLVGSNGEVKVKRLCDFSNVATATIKEIVEGLRKKGFTG